MFFLVKKGRFYKKIVFIKKNKIDQVLSKREGVLFSFQLRYEIPFIINRPTC